jgi:DNA-binding winged helix-turn-helix (wHTH) protein
MEAPRINTVSPALVTVIGLRTGPSERVRSALSRIDAEFCHIQSMRQLRLVYHHREPDLVILEVAELSAERLNAQIDLLRGAGMRAPLFVISNGILPGDGPTIITDVVDFATAEATSVEIVARLARVLGQTQRKDPVDRPVSSLSPSRTINGVLIDWRTKEATYRGTTVRFTTAELRMFEAFLDNRGKTLSTGALLRTLWGEDRQRSESLVPVYIWALRGKLSRLDGAFGIETMIGVGYRLTIGATSPKKRKSGGPRNGPTRRSA